MNNNKFGITELERFDRDLFPAHDGEFIKFDDLTPFLEACKRKDELLEEIGKTVSGLAETIGSGEPQCHTYCDYACACEVAYAHWLKEAAKKINDELSREDV